MYEWTELCRLKYAELSWSIEVYHRGIKQFVGVERCVVRKAIAQPNHIGLALRAFPRLERHCFSNGISWFETKTDIIRQAVRAYLAKPIHNLNPEFVVAQFIARHDGRSIARLQLVLPRSRGS